MKRFMSCTLGLFAVACIAHAKTDQVDADLLRAARGQEAAVIRSLQEMVSIDSGSDDGPGVLRMADYLEGRLKALGVMTERIPASTGPGQMVKGTLTGSGTLRVLLLAHMDTVCPKDVLTTEPYRRDGNKLYGPGIADDKGGIAVILHALAILQQAGWRDYDTVTVLFNPDEELGSPGSGEAIAAVGAEHDVVLSFEPNPAKAIAKSEGVLLAAAGTAQAHMTVEGVASHAGSAPDYGRNALIELAHQLLQTRDVAKTVEGAQLNWTTASAGLKRNQIPARAEAGADVRLLDLKAGDQLMKALQAKVAESRQVPDTTTTVRLEPGRPPYRAGPRGEAVAQQARAIYAELDGRALIFHPVTYGGTDAGFAQRSGRPAVLESLGLSGWDYHARNEYIEIDSIVPRLYLTTRLLQELAKGTPPIPTTP